MKNINLYQTAIVFLLLLMVYPVSGQQIQIKNSATVKLNNEVSLVVMNGTINNNGNLQSTASSVILRGTDTFKIKGNNPLSLDKLILDNSTSKPIVLETPVKIGNSLKLLSSTTQLQTNDLLTIQSNATKTAMIDVIPTGAIINGNVTIERYIPAHRAWYLLSAPLLSSGAPTIHAAWQEGALNATDNPHPGYGTHITGATSPNNGFDINSAKTASCKELINGNWVGVTNTDIQKVTDQSGYMLFVRGSRANQLNLGTNAAADNTILRSTGQINNGNISKNIAATGTTIIGNPFAAAVNFATLTRSAHVPNTFYVWDPLLSGTKGVGGFVTVSYNGSSYDVTASLSNVNQYVQSGTAIAVISDGNAGNITFKESDKVDYRRIGAAREAITNSYIKTEIYLHNADSTWTLYDGVINGFGDTYDNALDLMDAPKLTSGVENIGIYKNNKWYSIERRLSPDLNQNDTITLSLFALGVKQYKLKITGVNMNYSSIQGFIKDHTLNTLTPIDINGENEIIFNNATAVANYLNRFSIYLQTLRPLAVHDINFSAFKHGGFTHFNWDLPTTDVKMISLESAANGVRFDNLYSLDASEISTRNHWQFAPNYSGMIYYRLKCTDQKDAISYSKTIALNYDQNNMALMVSPTLVNEGQLITIAMQAAIAGNYQLNLKTLSGQSITQESFRITANGNFSYPYAMQKNVAAGIYILELIYPDNKVNVIKIVKVNN